jgi:hypothetical protein
LGKDIKCLLAGKASITKLSGRLRNPLAFIDIGTKAMETLMGRKTQVRFE